MHYPAKSGMSKDEEIQAHRRRCLREKFTVQVYKRFIKLGLLHLQTQVVAEYLTEEHGYEEQHAVQQAQFLLAPKNNT